jgi:WD40 repeat protein
MRYRLIVIGWLLLFPALTIGQEAPKQKKPIPGQEAQAKIEALLQELYKEDFAKAQKDSSLQSRLAQTLLFEGKETKDDVAGRYVLFLKAHTLAAQAGDVQTALMAADELAHDFDIPPGKIFQMKIAMLQQASKAQGAAPDAYQTVVDRALMMLDDTLDADDFPSSLALIAAAEQAARKLRSLALVASIRKRQEEIARQEKEFSRWQPFADRLAKNPGDQEANLEMGKYHALVKGNWDRGLPMIRLGPKGKLQTLAVMELDAIKKGAVPKLASDWLEESKSLDPALRTQALLRAEHWYLESLASAGDKTRADIDARLHEIAKLLPGAYRIGEIVSEWKKIDVPAGPVYGCSFTPDARRFICTGYDGTLLLYDTRTGKEIRRFEGHAGKIWTAVCFDDGIHAATGGFDNTVRLWDLAASSQSKILTGPKDYVRSVAVHRNSLVIAGGDDRKIWLWDLLENHGNTLSGHDHTVWSVALSRDGARALSGSLDKTVRLWDLPRGKQLKKLEGHTDTVLAVAFTPDGRRAVSGSTDKTLRLWDLDTGETIRVFTGSEGYVQSLAISPDGQRILSAGQDKLLRLWDAGTGREIRKLEGHTGQVWHVAFSRDGRQAISCGQDGTVRIWGGAR